MLTGRRLRRGLMMVVPLLVATVSIGRAIVVAPHAVFIDHRTRSGSLTLVNSGDRPEEVIVEPIFGYPTSDSAGRVYVYLEPDSATAAATGRSAAQWIRAFPRRAVVEPGQRQVVRLLAEPPPDLPDGEYWSRLVVTSQAVQGGGMPDTNGVRVGLSLRVRTVVALTYRKGDLTTGVAVHDLEASFSNDSLLVRPRLERLGEGAFLGRLEVQVVDSFGEVVHEVDQNVAVYTSLHRFFAYRMPELPPGEYLIRLRLDTNRDDVPREVILPAEPVADSVWATRE